MEFCTPGESGLNDDVVRSSLVHCRVTIDCCSRPQQLYDALTDLTTCINQETFERAGDVLPVVQFERRVLFCQAVSSAYTSVASMSVPSRQRHDKETMRKERPTFAYKVFTLLAHCETLLCTAILGASVTLKSTDRRLALAADFKRYEQELHDLYSVYEMMWDYGVSELIHAYNRARSSLWIAETWFLPGKIGQRHAVITDLVQRVTKKVNQLLDIRSRSPSFPVSKDHRHHHRRMRQRNTRSRSRSRSRSRGSSRFPRTPSPPSSSGGDNDHIDILTPPRPPSHQVTPPRVCRWTSDTTAEDGQGKLTICLDNEPVSLACRTY